MSHKKKAYQKMIAGGVVPKRTHHSADAVMLEGDALAAPLEESMWIKQYKTGGAEYETDNT